VIAGALEEHVGDATPTVAAAVRQRVPTLAQLGVRVSVVIAALNEAENLPYVFARLPEGLHEVIVVDGQSTDDTVAVARRLRPGVVILTQSGRGKGNALADGFAACTGEIIVALDADGSTDAAEIPRFVAALCSGADFVKGSRFAQGGASSDITVGRSIGNHVLGAIVNALFGTRYTDLCYGYNAFWARCLPYIRVDCEGFEVETLINVRVAKAGLIVHEVPSYERPRMYGHSNLHAIRDGTRVLRTIVLERMSMSGRPRPRIAHRVVPE
jgi:glycosyltransferase involved in cell wall biosynthesis